VVSIDRRIVSVGELGRSCAKLSGEGEGMGVKASARRGEAVDGTSGNGEPVDGDMERAGVCSMTLRARRIALEVVWMDALLAGYPCLKGNKEDERGLKRDAPT
jgi:hypothetical protein